MRAAAQNSRERRAGMASLRDRVNPLCRAGSVRSRGLEVRGPRAASRSIVDRDAAEYILSTFTHTGFMAEKERGPDGSQWAPGGIGERVLAAYDALG
jgi:hypothetical protein